METLYQNHERQARRVQLLSCQLRDRLPQELLDGFFALMAAEENLLIWENAVGFHDGVNLMCGEGAS